jgi:hypothetical protein
MEEAKHSFNVKFRMQGFECQLTIRDEEEGTGLIVSKAQSAIRMLAGIVGVTPTNGNGRSAAGPEAAHPPAPVTQADLEHAPVCPTCGQSDELELVSFERDGRPRQAFKCQRCKKWLPDKRK